MTDFQNLVIEPLNPTHDRTGFQCGIEALDRYLKKQAKQDIKRRISRVFVATKPDNPKAVIGYYTLSTLSIELNQLPEKRARKLPKHPVPAALIGRLAISNAAQGQGVGKLLLEQIKERLGIRAKGRKIYERDDEYQLREGHTVYGDWPDSEYENTFAWKLVN